MNFVQPKILDTLSGICIVGMGISIIMFLYGFVSFQTAFIALVLIFAFSYLVTSLVSWAKEGGVNI